LSDRASGPFRLTAHALVAHLWRICTELLANGGDKRDDSHGNVVYPRFIP